MTRSRSRGSKSDEFEGVRVWHGLRKRGSRKEDRLMRRRYHFIHLTRQERELIESLFQEELEIQTWYSLAWVDAIGGETRIFLQ